ncbi:MAG: dihydroneopterin aldolase [Opitutae bacterium]|nr:dihydroneopterin aldolase [Opitutae bacterium]
MKPSDRLVLTSMSFRACHGVLPVERRRRQEFRVTVELEVPLARAGRTDALGDTIDYCAVQGVVRAVVEGAHRKLIEALAEDIAQRLLAAFPSVRAVSVALLKPSPPVKFKFAGVSVRLRRERARRRR